VAEPAGVRIPGVHGARTGIYRMDRGQATRCIVATDAETRDRCGRRVLGGGLQVIVHTLSGMTRRAVCVLAGDGLYHVGVRRLVTSRAGRTCYSVEVGDVAAHVAAASGAGGCEYGIVACLVVCRAVTGAASCVIGRNRALDRTGCVRGVTEIALILDRGCDRILAVLGDERIRVTGTTADRGDMNGGGPCIRVLGNCRVRRRMAVGARERPRAPDPPLRIAGVVEAMTCI